MKRGRGPNGWALVVIGLLAAGLGLAMWQSGVSHRRDYQDFEACRASTQTICVLHQNGSQAHSVSEFKKNYEAQLRFGAALLIAGVVSTIAGAVMLVLRRRRAALEASAPPPPANGPPPKV